MEHFQSRKFWLSFPVLCCEAAVVGSVHGMYLYFEYWLQAILLAVSFSVLLIGSVMMAARNIPNAVRYLLIAGGFLLFIVQSISTISSGFLHATDIFPAVQLVRLWGGTPPEITARFAVIYGLAINVVGAMYWLSLSFWWRAEEQKKEEQKRQLAELEQLFR